MARRADVLTSAWLLALLALVVGVGAFTAVVAIAGDDDDSAVTASSSSSTSSTTAPAATSSSWFAVLRSDLDTRTTAAQLQPTVAPFGDRGRVIDTDDFRTGDGTAPDFYPRPGVVAAVVGPFSTAAEASTWCSTERPGQSCTVRQLVPPG
jgi:hypothetical protein